MKKVLQSLINPKYIEKTINNNYHFLQPNSVNLLSQGDNDHYLVENFFFKYVFRLYRSNKYWLGNEENYHFEFDVLNFLKENGVNLSYPIAKSDGTYLGKINCAEGLRYFCLFNFIHGQKKDISNLIAFKYGENISNIHNKLDLFKTDKKKQLIDENFLIKNPYKRINKKFKSDELKSTCEKYFQIIKGYSENCLSLDWGVILGDCHRNNIIVDDNKIIPLDFDLCGYGYRMYDLTTIYVSIKSIPNLDFSKKKKLWELFLEGYRKNRKIKIEKNIFNAFCGARLVWVLGDVLTWPNFSINNCNVYEIINDIIKIGRKI